MTLDLSFLAVGRSDYSNWMADFIFLTIIFLHRRANRKSSAGFFTRHFYFTGAMTFGALAWVLIDDYFRTVLPPIWDIGAWNLLRVDNGITSGHVVSWLPLIIIMAYSFYRESTGEKDFVRTWFILAYGIALHEGLWYIFDFAAEPSPSYVGQSLFHYGAFLWLLYLGLWGTRTLYPRLFSYGKWPFAVVLVYDCAWFALGWPISLSLSSGPTAFYFSQYVGALENLGWLSFGFVFLWAVTRFYANTGRASLSVGLGDSCAARRKETRSPASSKAARRGNQHKSSVWEPASETYVGPGRES